MQRVQNLDDALAQRGAPYYAVIYDDQCIDSFLHHSVGHVVHVGCKVVAAFAFGDESAELDVLCNKLFGTHLAFAESAKSVNKSKISHFRSVGNERNHAVFQVFVAGFEHLVSQKPAEHLALPVYVRVIAARKIDSFEGTLCNGLCRHNLRQPYLSAAAYNKRLPRFKLLYDISAYSQNRLNHRPFAGQDHNLVISVVERRPYAPRISYSKAFAAAGHAADAVASVPGGGRTAEDVLNHHIVFDQTGDFATCPAIAVELPEKPLDLAVQPETQLLEQKVGIGILAGMLPAARHVAENLLDICQVEIPTQTKRP